MLCNSSVPSSISSGRSGQLPFASRRSISARIAVLCSTRISVHAWYRRVGPHIDPGFRLVAGRKYLHQQYRIACRLALLCGAHAGDSKVRDADVPIRSNMRHDAGVRDQRTPPPHCNQVIPNQCTQLTLDDVVGLAGGRHCLGMAVDQLPALFARRVPCQELRRIHHRRHYPRHFRHVRTIARCPTHPHPHVVPGATHA